MYTILLLIIFFACVAMLIREGFWSNAITLLNVILAALLATSYFEMLADFLDSKWPVGTYLLDFLSLWAIFCGAFILFRATTDALSRVRVRFKMPVEWAGGGLLAVWTAWVVVCFTSMTLHTAPLARDYLGGAAKPDPNEASFLGFSPDRQWLAFAQKLSRGAFAAAPPAGVAGEDGKNVFDPQAEFIYKYGQRRAEAEKNPKILVRR